jgi:hypothetical protein
MNMRFFDPSYPVDDYSAVSTGMTSAYGKIESGDIGTGMLAPYTASKCSTANQHSDMQTGGKNSPTKKSTTKKSTTKKSPTKKSTTKKSPTKKSPTKKSTTKKSTTKKSPTKKSTTKKSPTKKSTIKKKPTTRKMLGGESEYAPVNFNELTSHESLNILQMPHMSGGKNVKSKRSKSKSISMKNLKGGMESSGATPMNMRFFDPSYPVDDYSAVSTGMTSAYGKIESGNIGTGMLAPYTASKCSTANQHSDMQTGGKNSPSRKGNTKKSTVGGNNYASFSSDNIENNEYTQYEPLQTGGKKKINKNKSLKGGDGPIPYISDAGINAVQKVANSAINDFTSFMEKLDQDYLKSVEDIKAMKIGDQRLVQGGSKKKNRKLKGGNGSDYALTSNSRGPVNAPDDYWGVPGETWFRQFSKTGDYIPNSMLPYAATPKLAGIGNSTEIMAYDSLGTDYGSV